MSGDKDRPEAGMTFKKTQARHDFWKWLHNDMVDPSLTAGFMLHKIEDSRRQIELYAKKDRQAWIYQLVRLAVLASMRACPYQSQEQVVDFNKSKEQHQWGSVVFKLLVFLNVKRKVWIKAKQELPKMIAQEAKAEWPAVVAWWRDRRLITQEEAELIIQAKKWA